MGGSSNTQPTQTTTSVLSPEQRELMGLAMPGIRDFAATVPQRYQGSGVAPFDPNQVAGQEAVLGAVPTQQNLAAQGAATSGQLMNNPWDPVTNPNLQGAITAATRPIQDQLTQQLGGIRQEAITRGGFGGSRQGIAEGIASGQASQAVGDTANKLVTGVYDTNVNAALKAMGLLPTTQQAQLTPGISQSGVGDVRQTMAQAQLGETMGNFNYDQLAPFLQSRELMSLLQGLPGGSTTSTANNPPQPNMVMQGLGGAASGAALGSAVMPGIGTAAGAGIGALLPFLLA